MKSKTLLAVITLMTFASCASKPAKDPGANASHTASGKAIESKSVSMEGKLLANEQESNLMTELTFSKGSRNLSSAAKMELKELVNKARAKGKVDEVKVITWADQEYPSVHKKNLSEDQVKLVENRNKSIEEYLSGLDFNLNLELISMASRPNAFRDMFSTDDAKIKKSLETAGIPNTDTTVKVPGKASKSIVIFIMEE